MNTPQSQPKLEPAEQALQGWAGLASNYCKKLADAGDVEAAQALVFVQNQGIQTIKGELAELQRYREKAAAESASSAPGAAALADPTKLKAG